MSAIFGTPALPPAPPPPPPAPARDDGDSEAARRRALIAARNAKGRAATILTGETRGGGALTGDAPVVRKTLLGG